MKRASGSRARLVHQVANCARAASIGVKAGAGADVGYRTTVIGGKQARAGCDEWEVQLDVALAVEPGEGLLEARKTR